MGRREKGHVAGRPRGGAGIKGKCAVSSGEGRTLGGKGVSDRLKSRLVEKLGHTARMPSSSRCPGQEPRRGLADTVRR